MPKLTNVNGAQRFSSLNQVIKITSSCTLEWKNLFAVSLQANISYTELILSASIVELCGREFSSEELFLKHGPSHHTNLAFYCNLCGMSFYHQSTLSRHSKIHAQPKQCAVCHIELPFDSHLRRHLLNYHNDVDGTYYPRVEKIKIKGTSKRSADNSEGIGRKSKSMDF